MSRAALVGVEDMQVPRFTGVIGDFIGQLIRLSSSDKGDFGNIADELETSILDGTVRVTADKTGYPEIAYGHNKMQLRSGVLHRWSLKLRQSLSTCGMFLLGATS